MVMKSISVSEAKATLSAQLRRVRNGEEVVISDRGHPVARLIPFESANHDRELQQLEQAGLIRLNRTTLPPQFWKKARPTDPEGSTRATLLSEREEGF